MASIFVSWGSPDKAVVEKLQQRIKSIGLDVFFSAATWLVENRKIRAVGLDTASIDHGQSRLFHSHRVLFKANIPAFENVANLARLPATGAWVIALPMKIKGGSGGPLRIAARVPG